MSSSVVAVKKPGFVSRNFPTFAAAVASLGWPILTRQLRADFRKNRFFVSHLVSLSVLSLALIVLMTLRVGEEQLTPTVVGRSLFSMFFIVQYFIVLVIFPAFSATAFSEERANESLDLLLTTNLSPVELVWGKFLAATIYCLMYVIGSVPILSIAFLFGGVLPHEVLAAYVILMVLTLLVSMVGVCVSSCCRSNIQAFLWTYLVVIVGLAVSYWYAPEAAGDLSGVQTTTGTILDAMGRGREGFALRLLTWCGFGLTVFAYLFLFTANRIRPAADDKTSALRALTLLVVPAGLASAAAISYEEFSRKGVAAAYAFDGWVLLAAFALFLVAWIFPTEDIHVSRRNRARFSRFRGILFPLRIFSPGALGGFAYSMVMTLTVCGGFLVFWLWATSGSSAPEWATKRVREVTLTLPFCLCAFAAFGFLLASCDFSPRYSRLTALFASVIVLLLPLIFYLRETPDTVWTLYYLSPATIWDSLNPERVSSEAVPLVLFGVAVVHLAKIVYAVLAAVFLIGGVLRVRRAGRTVEAQAEGA